MDLIYKAGLQYQFDTGVKAVHFGTPQEVNPLQLFYARDYYAWLDVVEEEPLSYLDDFGLSPERDLVPFHTWPAPDTEELHGRELHEHYGAQSWPELGVAVFDCIEASYFNDNLDPFRRYYSKTRGENIDDPHDPAKAYDHGKNRRDYHRWLLDDFYTNKDVAPWTFLTVHVAFANVTASWRALLHLFARHAWYGLRLVASSSLGYGVGVVDSFTDQSLPFPVRLLTFYDVATQRRNNLEHVISLDFVPDLRWDPQQGPTPTPLPQPLPVSSGPTMGERLRKQRDKNSKKKQTSTGLHAPIKLPIQKKERKTIALALSPERKSGIQKPGSTRALRQMIQRDLLSKRAPTLVMGY